MSTCPNDYRYPCRNEAAVCHHCHDDPPRGHRCPNCGVQNEVRR